MNTNTTVPIHWIRRIDTDSRPYKYKNQEQVNVLKEGQNVDLRSKDNVSDTCEQSVEIDLLKQTLLEHLKEKESLLQRVTLLKNNFKKEESRNIDREICSGQFLKELRTNTFSGSDHGDAKEHIEKVIEIVNLFHIPNITIDQVMLKAFPMSLTEAASFLDSRGAIPFKTVVDAKVVIQEMAEYSQKWHNGTSRSRSTETSDGLADIQAQLNNLGREIKKVNEKVYAAQVGCEQCKGPHYTKDCPLQEMGK
ncbi:hypothetical protein Tco_0758440 [Tanacetum coccineum]